MSDLGPQLQFPIFLGIVALFLVVVGVSIFLVKRSDYPDESPWVIGIVAGAGFGAISLIILAILAVPYNPRYWDLHGVTGKVEKVTVAVQANDDSVSNTFTTTLSGHDQRFVLTNPRIREYVGREIELVCSIGWVYQGADQWSCDIRKV